MPPGVVAKTKKPKAMTTTEIILLVISILLFLTGFVGYVRNKVDLVWIFLLLFAIFLAFFLASIESRLAYEEALKGNNPYEMKIHYEQRGDDYVPTDTVFVKRKNP